MPLISYSILSASLNLKLGNFYITLVINDIALELPIFKLFLMALKELKEENVILTLYLINSLRALHLEIHLKYPSITL